MKRYIVFAAICAGIFGLCLSRVAESQRRSNRIIQLQENLIEDPMDSDSRDALERYSDRKPYSMTQIAIIFATGAISLGFSGVFAEKRRKLAATQSPKRTEQGGA